MQPDEFGKFKANKQAKYLLPNDIKFFKNQIYDAINLNSEEFMKSFDGESDYIYKVKSKEHPKNQQ